MRTGNKNGNMNKVKISMKRLKIIELEQELETRMETWTRLRLVWKKMRAEMRKYDKCIWLVLKRESKKTFEQVYDWKSKIFEKIARNAAHVLV